MIESVMVDADAEDTTAKQVAPTGKKVSKKPDKGKAKTKGETSVWKDLPPQVRFVGHAVVRQVSNFLSRIENVHETSTVTDTDGK
jgi:hypothetical protein